MENRNVHKRGNAFSKKTLIYREFQDKMQIGSSLFHTNIVNVKVNFDWYLNTYFLGMI